MPSERQKITVETERSQVVWLDSIDARRQHAKKTKSCIYLSPSTWLRK